MTVSQDATSLYYVPASAAEWTELLSGTGISGPSSLWLCQESSSTLADSIGSITLTPNAGLSYQQSATGWTRKGVAFGDNTANYLKGTAPDFATTSGLLLQMFTVGSNPAAGMRALNCFGFTQYEEAQVVPGPKLRGQSGANTATGTTNYSGVLIVVTKYDKTNSVHAVYTGTETLKATFTAQSGAQSTDLYLLGDTANSTDATMVYAAFWSGSSAEMSDGDVSTLYSKLVSGPPVVTPPTEPTTTLPTTLEALQNQSHQIAIVVALDGYPHLFSNEDEAQVQAAWASTDWATKSVIGNIVIELDNNQSLDPWNPFRGGGRCIMKVLPDTADTFGIDLARTDAGAETFLDETATRTSTLFVGYADGFPTQGEAYCGVECFDYGFIAGRRLHGTLGSVIGSNRGKYVAFGVKDSVSTYGAVRFADHHRVAVQDNGVRFAPVVSAQPRTWKGRRASVWMHAKDPVTGALNSKADALCVFYGEFSEPRDDDPNGWISVLFEHALDRIPKTTLLRDQWSARVDYGVQLKVGQTFQFLDFDGTTTRTANNLVVVESGASGSNQVDAGFYGHEEIASIVNRWLGGESGAGRIAGRYTLRSPEDYNGSPRSIWHFIVPGSTSTQCWFAIMWPTVGWATAFGMPGQQFLHFDKCGAFHIAKSPNEVKPFDFIGADTNGTLQMMLESQVGIFQNQRATMPGGAKAVLNVSTLAGDATRPYGIFLLESETPMLLLATVENNKLRYIRPLSFSLASNLTGYGDLINNPKVPLGSGPPTVRQIFIHEGPAKTVLKWLFFSTGTMGYNHPDFDLLPHGQGLGLAYDVLGETFELSCDMLPGANDTLTIVLEKPRTLQDVISADLIVRNAHLIWREGGFRWASWTTPSSAMATTVLDQTNKAEAAGVKAPHRATAVLDSSWVKNYCKIQYNRDIAQVISGGANAFLSPPIVLENATNIDDQGGIPSPVTLDLNNVYNDSEQVGQGVRSLVAGLASWMPMWSAPLWKVRRSIAPTLYEGFGVGEVVAMTDPDLRDPTTGQRPTTLRPGLVIGHRYQIQTAPAPEKVKFAGEVDVVSLMSDRVFAYAPAAEVDETYTTGGGFTAGYDGNRTFRFKAHEHSESSDTVDIGSLAVGDKVKLIRIDPDDPATTTSWDFTLTNVDAANNQATVNVAPSSPSFDTSGRYRLVYGGFASVQSSQYLKSFQAGATKTLVETDVADVYGDNVFPLTVTALPTEYDHTTLPELPANVSYGPNVGASRDAGYDKELALLVDNMLDHKSRRSSPAFGRSPSTNASNDGWQILRVEEMFIGDLLYAGGINRYLWLAPLWRSAGGFVGAPQLTQLRVWISGYPPSGSSNVNLFNATQGYTIKAPAAANSWSVMSDDTDYRSDIPQGYPLANFNGHQFVYIIIEGTKSASVLGLYQVSEGQRIEI